MIRKNRIPSLAIIFTIVIMLTQSAVAYIPQGWIYIDYPYMYDQDNHVWYYINESNIQWIVDLTNNNWSKFDLIKQDWHFFDWPYSYSNNRTHWNYWNISDIQYVNNLTSDNWSFLGENGGQGTNDTRVTLTWDNNVDLDLWIIEPSGERIFYNNPISSTTGGHLESGDKNDHGPENIFWSSERIKAGLYTVKVDRFSGSAPANYTVNIYANNSNSVYTGTIYADQTHTIATYKIGGIYSVNTDSFPTNSLTVGVSSEIRGSLLLDNIAVSNRTIEVNNGISKLSHTVTTDGSGGFLILAAPLDTQPATLDLLIKGEVISSTIFNISTP